MANVFKYKYTYMYNVTLFNSSNKFCEEIATAASLILNKKKGKRR